jgi:Family of unknown function (DUF6152)
MSPKTCGAFIALAVLSMVAPIWAHHSPSAIFDMTKRTPLSGVLTRVDWINPHVIVLIDVKTDSGKTETWKFESNPPLWFKKVGVNRADFAKAIGQPVKVEVNRARDVSNLFGYLYKITFQDGTSLELTYAG